MNERDNDQLSATIADWNIATAVMFRVTIVIVVYLVLAMNGIGARSASPLTGVQFQLALISAAAGWIAISVAESVLSIRGVFRKHAPYIVSLSDIGFVAAVLLCVGGFQGPIVALGFLFVLASFNPSRPGIHIFSTLASATALGMVAFALSRLTDERAGTLYVTALCWGLMIAAFGLFMEVLRRATWADVARLARPESNVYFSTAARIGVLLPPILGASLIAVSLSTKTLLGAMFFLLFLSPAISASLVLLRPTAPKHENTAYVLVCVFICIGGAVAGFMSTFTPSVRVSEFVDSELLAAVSYHCPWIENPVKGWLFVFTLMLCILHLIDKAFRWRDNEARQSAISRPSST